MKYFSIVTLMISGLLSPQAFAQDWKFIVVDRSSDSFSVREGFGDLNRTKDGLKGVLTTSEDIKFEFELSIRKNRVEGKMENQESDAGPYGLKGTYTSTRVPDTTECWETIQLTDGHNYVGLFRNDYNCKP